MKNIDRKINKQLHSEYPELSKSVRMRIDQTLNNLEEHEVVAKPFYLRHRIASGFACFILVFLLLLPNISVTYAKTMEQIPIIGELIRVVVIRNYFYRDSTHELNVKVPALQSNKSEGVDKINQDSKQLSAALVKKFYDELEEFGENAHGAIYVDYKVITNSDTWFTLQLRITEVNGSSNMYYKYYNLDKQSGKVARLADLVDNDQFYQVVEDDIKQQMKAQMKMDPSLVYWVEKSSFGEEFVKISKDHNYYWNNDGNLVISFNKYDVAPGSMGTPEFVIQRELIQKYIKKEFSEDILNKY